MRSNSKTPKHTTCRIEVGSFMPTVGFVAQRSICNAAAVQFSSAKEWKNRRVTNRTLRYTASEAFQHPHVVIHDEDVNGEMGAVQRRYAHDYTAQSLELPKHLGIPLEIHVENSETLRQDRACVKSLSVGGPVKDLMSRSANLSQRFRDPSRLKVKASECESRPRSSS